MYLEAAAKSLLSFCQSAPKRLRESEEKADDQDQESDDSNCQDAQVAVAKESEVVSHLNKHDI